MLFKRNKPAKRDAALGLDLGSGQLKAAVVERRAGKLHLLEYAIRPLPPMIGKPGKDARFIEELLQLMGGLRLQDRRACVAISCGSAMVCHTEFPRMPLAEVKSALKLNSTRYLRRDFSSYYLDAFELAEHGGADNKSPKMKVLVGGAQKEEVTGYRDALVAARIRPEVIELAAVSVVNAFQAGQPESADEVVLLVDIGARSTSINFVQHGQPLITRIMHFGGLQLSEYVGQILTLDAGQAEDAKVKMSEPVQALVRSAISPLARELRSSIDFFERQHECHVSRALACGGSACSAKVLEFLGEAVGIHVECWNPVQALDTSRLNGEGPKLISLGPSMAAVIGAATAQL